MSDDSEQPESDGLDALAKGLEGNEGDEADDELDLAGLAAVAGSRASNVADVASDDKLVLAGSAPMPRSAPAPASLPAAVPAVAAAAATVSTTAATSSRSWLVPTLVAFALGVGVMGYLLGRSSRPEDAAATAGAPPPAAEAVPAANTPIEPPPSAAPAPALAVAPQPPVSSGPSPASNARAKPAERATELAKQGSLVPAPAVGNPPVTSAPAAEPEQPSKPAEPGATLAKTEPAPSRSVDQLLDEALASPGERRAAAVAEQAVLPEAPTREEVTQAMAVLLPAIRGCAMGQVGLATAGIVVRGDGRVASVELSGAPFEGTASGRCMEGVLRRARFSRFRQPTFRVRFPFSIQ